MTPKFYKATLVAMLACVALTACSDDDDDDNGTDVVENVDPTENVTDVDNEMETDNEEVADFAFNDAAFGDYIRVDRAGMPAVATVLIDSKDSYNAANPADDAAGTFEPEIIGNLSTIHGVLDDDLDGAGLTPCTVVGDGMGTCVASAAPLIVPDTISIDTASDAGFPNGRLLGDPVIDVTLALALLELTGDPAPQTVFDLVGELNPEANDLEFSADFPFLADPH